jgi:hypothetical protein
MGKMHPGAKGENFSCKRKVDHDLPKQSGKGEQSHRAASLRETSIYKAGASLR